ncbi:dUTP diphosphatase [Desulfosporosinus sp. BICA1-9]|uniref:dUTP diphosphatase n=1 Tax=Desulfosporosinus sp. BICA1-9 TaxID=1531958 RepID=UPI00054AFFF7|nr:dUTP diphosphatase [Desulfosporosinus sp. BICA1-9]KJS47317.1 MAG: deoxyuridine 5'-triphosphate nucleotidohydrolase [Peptococcaceae bacterium BRH_c23]KJS86550.1 MAG: deoxyuridine 5'-triphosphate nucleotidohydrolase [Desulfosporosinus sp. BICA1-9]HBW36930.1 dUTP diphosphatase [Desulfosporosinus sp.]
MTDSITVKVKRMANNSLALPTYATAASAGVDLSADLREPITVSPGENVKIPTGLAIELPSQSVVALVFARSGLASRHGIGLTNGVGVIDSDYRGEIQVLIQNLGTQPVTIKPGDRIAQMLFMPIFHANFEDVAELQETPRGAGGFGSTGI